MIEFFVDWDSNLFLKFQTLFDKRVDVFFRFSNIVEFVHFAHCMTKLRDSRIVVTRFEVIEKVFDGVSKEEVATTE